MKVTIKSIGNELDIKNNGLEIAVYRPNSPQDHIGDLYVRKKGLVWCPGQTTPNGSGIHISWKKFMNLMEKTEIYKK